MRHVKAALTLAIAVWLATIPAQAADEIPGRTASPPGSLSVMFVGDIMLDGGPGHAIASGRDPFAACAALLMNADFTIGNLECVLGRGGKRVLKNYSFRAAKDSPTLLKRYFSGVSVANNHSFDFGPEGLVEMLAILDREGIPRFGAGATLAEARRPLLLEKKGEENGLRIALLGANGYRADNYAPGETTAGVAPLREAEILAAIAAARKQADAVVPFVHWGPELVAQPREADMALARKMIDAGASAVIGSHPHVTQTIDIHRGVPIIYSLGNFVFDYFPDDPPQWTGWVAKLTFAKNQPVGLETRAVVLDPAGLPSPARED